MNPHQLSLQDLLLTRRQFLHRCGLGFGMLGLAGILRADETGSALDSADNALSPLAPRQPPLPAKAKRVIHLFMNGGQSHIDTWDPKPELAKYDGKPLPGIGGVALPSPFAFSKSGQCGTEVSELFPEIGKCIDDITVIRSLSTDIPAHEFATLLMNTGNGRLIRPSLGSWVTYGLGSLNQNLPGYIAMCPDGFPTGGAPNWQCGFLPGAYQGTHVNTRYTQIERLIENIKNGFTSRPEQRRQLDLLQQLNELHLQQQQKDAQLEARIRSFELAYQMQIEATDAFDINQETPATRQLYGDSIQGRQMLIARRLVERGVRFVQVWYGAGGPWDTHNALESSLRRLAKGCDQAIAALLKDLKSRGLLEDTLVVCSSEFGRTPTKQINNNGGSGFEIVGRDHHSKCFSAWVAGGGVKPGMVYGATDDFGYKVVENKVHVHDLHATILHLLGFDHEKLTFRYQGRDFRLTDVYGEVVKGILA
ncbi:MAG: DUF1501 domain-containing protein [Verrucomicrobiota bacterium]